VPDISDIVGMNILSNIMVELFSVSHGKLTAKEGKPLGDLATDLVIKLTGMAEEIPEAMTLLDNPLLNAYGSIEQTYLDLIKKAREIDTIHQGEWPLLLKAMTIPLSDQVFSDRRENVERVAVSRVGRALIERLRVLESYPQLLNM